MRVLIALDGSKASKVVLNEALARPWVPETAFYLITVEHEAPAKSILEEAKKWDADLIVMGSHGRRGLDRFAMGSVSESVAMTAHCSVEVVRPPHHHELHKQKEEIYESQRSHDGHALHMS